MVYGKTRGNDISHDWDSQSQYLREQPAANVTVNVAGNSLNDLAKLTTEVKERYYASMTVKSTDVDAQAMICTNPLSFKHEIAIKYRIGATSQLVKIQVDPFLMKDEADVALLIRDELAKSIANHILSNCVYNSYDIKQELATWTR